MGRTTIFRSSARLTVACLVAAAFAIEAQAQEPADQGQVPTVHVVQDGETLWNLAALYFGDPYLWPEIYRLNTLVVEDPHWIFPGEELLLGPADTTAVVADPGDQSQVELVGQTPFDRGDQPPAVESSRFRPAPVQGGSVAIGASSQENFRAVRAIDFYSAGFLTERDELPFGEVRGAVGSRAGRIATATSAVVHQEIEVEAPRSAAYQIGDTLLLLDQRRELSNWGHVMVPTGLARVTNVSGRRALARIIMQFGLVVNEQVSLPLEPFRDPGSVRPQPVEDGVRGNVIAIRDRNEVPIQNGILFIDVGRGDGVVPGDVFEVVRPGSARGFADAPEERIAILRIVHVRENSASGMLSQIYRQGVTEGAQVKLTLKMPT